MYLNYLYNELERPHYSYSWDSSRKEERVTNLKTKSSTAERKTISDIATAFYRSEIVIPNPLYIYLLLGKWVVFYVM